MKKLVYVLALPILLGLVYGFTINYVDVTRTVQTDIKTLQTDSLLGKPIEGVVVEFNKKKSRKTFSLKTATGIYSIEYNNANNKLKIGDKVVALISASILPPAPVGDPDRFKNIDITYVPKTIKDLKGNLIYEYKPEKYAFLYEANKARFASSKIKSIEKGANGKIEKIVLNDGFFTISLNLKTQSIKDDTFKVGDKVLVKFIGEKLVSKNTYSTDKMIVLYSEPKKYMIKNEALYNRFYLSDGKQKVAAMKNGTTKVAGPVEPKIISFKKIIGDVKHKISYMENAVIDIVSCRLEAEYVELDQLNGKMIAKNAVLKGKEGGSATAKIIVFNLKDGSYRAENGTGATKVSKGLDFDQQMLQKMRDSLTKADNKEKTSVSYSARDSVKVSRDKSIVTLYGKAKLDYKNFAISADEATYNRNTEKITAKNLIVRNKITGITMVGSYGEFDINGKAEVWQGNK